MRFIVMHKVDATMEAGTLPDRELVKKMGVLVGESLKNGIFVDGAGLHRSARRVRLRCRGGTCEVERGPYEGGNELVAGMAAIRVASIDAAVEHARRLATALGDAEIEIGPVVEPWDLAGAPKPAHAEGEQFLLLVKGDPAYERGQALAPARDAALTRHLDGLAHAGVLTAHHRLAPTATGKRLTGPSGRRTWIDGPFAESKELVAGFSILEVPTLPDAIAWADRYAAILVENEVDVRRMAE
jgi:hypothetical protein